MAVSGGIILGHIDVAGMVEAVREIGLPAGNCGVREVRFHEPVFVGDLVSFNAETTSVGRVSISTRVSVESERFGERGQIVRLTEAEVVYVAINQKREKDAIGERAFTARA